MNITPESEIANDPPFYSQAEFSKMLLNVEPAAQVAEFDNETQPDLRKIQMELRVVQRWLAAQFPGKTPWEKNHNGG